MAGARLGPALWHVQQRYRHVAEAQECLKSAEATVGVAQEVVTREQAKLAAGRRSTAEVAEVARRLDEFNLDLARRTSDVMKAESFLREELGLPAAEKRRIVPVSPPRETEFVSDLNACLAQMNEHQPDIAQKRNAIAEHSPRTNPGDSDIQNELIKQDLLGTIDSKRDNLNRCLWWVNTVYTKLKKASRLRASYSAWVDAQRASFQKGSISGDRYLQTISRNADLLADEAQYKRDYNVSICMLEMAKGTLIDRDNIVIAETPRSSSPADGSLTPTTRNAKARAGAWAKAASTIESTTAFRESAEQPALLDSHATITAATPASPTSVLPAHASENGGKTRTAASTLTVKTSVKTAPKVWNFSVSIGRDWPFVIKGTITEGVDSGPGAAER